MQKLPKKYAHLQPYADENEITATTFHRRRQKGMTPEQAAKTPKWKKKKDEWILRAEKNGISRVTYYNRINKGWSKERASTEPTETQTNKRFERYSYYREKAIENGTHPGVYVKRVFDEGMSFEEAWK